MSGAAAVLALALLPAQAGFDEAIAAVAEGRFRAALAAAEAEPDALRRGQARLYVLHQGGDLGGALAAAREGLAASPDDLWLLERAAYVALSLRDGETAAGFSRRYLAAVGQAGLAPEERARLARQAEGYVEESAGLVAAQAARERAVGRARVVVAGGFGLALILLLALARDPRGESPRR